MVDPEAVRKRVLELIQGFDEFDEPEVLMDVLIDAVTIVETYRRVKRHAVAHLPELTKSVDALLRELEIIERTNRWSQESTALQDSHPQR